ncbi:MAG: flagellin [Bdellovibrionota bacterium]
MGLRIQTNMQSLNSQRALAISTGLNDLSMERISSGYRINKSSDDAAGLAISEKLKADVRSLNMAKRNANDGISMLQVAEGGMNEIGNVLTRLRELSIQGASDTIGNTEREFINKEYVSLKDEIDRITNSTEYNGTLLLVGENPKERIADGKMFGKTNQSPFEFQVGKNWYQGVDGQGISDPFGRNPVNVIRANFNQFDTSSTGLGIGLGSDNTLESTGTYIESENSNDSKLRAQMSITKLDDAISKIARFRADVGATQSRLNSTVSNLSTMSENFSAANSRIRDTDFAEETTKLTQSNILKQAGVAVLAQANQSPAAAVRLLG